MRRIDRKSFQVVGVDGAEHLLVVGAFNDRLGEGNEATVESYRVSIDGDEEQLMAIKKFKAQRGSLFDSQLRNYQLLQKAGIPTYDHFYASIDGQETQFTVMDDLTKGGERLVVSMNEVASPDQFFIRLKYFPELAEAFMQADIRSSAVEFEERCFFQSPQTERTNVKLIGEDTWFMCVQEEPDFLSGDISVVMEDPYRDTRDINVRVFDGFAWQMDNLQKEADRYRSTWGSRFWQCSQ